MVSSSGFSDDSGAQAVREAGGAANDALVETAAGVLEAGIKKQRDDNLAKPISEGIEEAEQTSATIGDLAFAAVSGQVNYDDPVAVSERSKQVESRLAELNAPGGTEGGAYSTMDRGYLNEMREQNLARGIDGYVMPNEEGERQYLEREQAKLATAFDAALENTANTEEAQDPIDTGVQRLDPAQ
jgi:hypothetical protein